MYYRIIEQLAKSVDAIETYLDKAERHAAAKKIDIGVLMRWRLAPDMGGLIYQIQSACDYLKGGAAWLSGQTPPKHDDDETTIAEARGRIRKTVAFARSVTQPQFADAAARRVGVSWSPSGMVIDGEGYLVEVVVPNVYFHVMAAYAILRQAGVDVGKMDFLGPIRWIPE